MRVRNPNVDHLISQVKLSYGVVSDNKFVNLLSEYEPWKNARILFAIMYSGEFESHEVRRCYYESFKSSLVDPWIKFKMFYLDLLYRFNITDNGNYKDKEILDKLPDCISRVRDRDRRFILRFKYRVAHEQYVIDYLYDKKMITVLKGDFDKDHIEPYSYKVLTTFCKYISDSENDVTLFDFISNTVLSDICVKYMKFIFENYGEDGFDCCIQRV